MHGDEKGRGGGLFDKSCGGRSNVSLVDARAQNLSGASDSGVLAGGRSAGRRRRCSAGKPRRTVRGALAANSCWARVGWALAGASASG